MCIVYTIRRFKKDRGQMFGEERGHFLIDSIEVTENPEKLCFSIKSVEKHNPTQTTTTLCKANSQSEYLIWAKALRDVVAGKANVTGSTGSTARTTNTATAAAGSNKENAIEDDANRVEMPQMTTLARMSS